MKSGNEGNMHSGNADFMRPALEFKWDDNFIPETELNPMQIDDPEEYLRMVRYEANQLPGTVEMEKDNCEQETDENRALENGTEEHQQKTPFSEQWVFYQRLIQKKESIGTVRNRLLNDTLKDKYIQRFALYRMMIDSARGNWKERLMHLSDKLEEGLPAPQDWMKWKEYIVDERREPEAEILLSMDYAETVNLTKHVIGWLQRFFRSDGNVLQRALTDTHSEEEATTTIASTKITTKTEARSQNLQRDATQHLLFWTYTLLAHLEDPVSSRTLSTISDFTRWLVEKRSKLPEGHPLLPQMHTLIAIGAFYFVQGKKEWL